MKNQTCFASTIPEVIEQLGTDLEQGLSSQEIGKRQKQFGENRLTEASSVPLWRRILSQFQSLIIGLLIVSAILAGFLGEWIDAVAILSIVLLNGILGFFQEDRAERAIAELRKLSAPMARVLRDKLTQSIPAQELVPGDILLVEAGDHVAADARLVASFGLRTLEASLTGESAAVDKSEAGVFPEGTSIGDRLNMIHAGTTVAAGKGRAIVSAIGMSTEIGSIAGLLQETVSEPTPLQRRLTELGRILVVACLAIVGVIFAIQWWRGEKIVDVFLTSVSLAVAAVPEGLPAVVTITLAIGLTRMAKRKAIIRKLPSVETLGSVSIICSDKTGTLTSNEMTVTDVRIAGSQFGITGLGYTPRGKIFLRHADHDGNKDPAKGSSTSPISQIEEHLTVAETDLAWLLRVGAMCNNATWRWDEKGQKSEVQGDPTEIALLVATSKAPHSTASMQVEMLHENPFDSDRKMMSQVYRLPDGSILLLAKGAPEVILNACTKIRARGVERPLESTDHKWINQNCSEMASDALRVLGLASRTIRFSGESTEETMSNEWTYEKELTFLGLVGMMDPPRAEAGEAVARCVAAGIRPIMITGDHPETALAVARSLKIAGPDSLAMSGSQLQGMSDQALLSSIEQYSVYARVSAQHKLRIVNAWRARGEVVAMTGDGVNDAPAVKAADIGIVMGITGTDVAKESADMILADDNFATIINAIEEGRGVYENIQKFLHYLLACNTSEVLFMFLSSLIGWPSPLVPIQILWINLVTDGIPALSLALEPLEKQLMSRPPRDPHESFLPRKRMVLIAIHGGLMAAVAMFAFYLYPHDTEEGLAKARTVAFCTIALTQVFFAIGCRSFEKTMPQIGPFSNPTIVWAMVGSVLLQIAVVSMDWSSRLLGATTLGIPDWTVVIGIALLPVTVFEVAKLVKKEPESTKSEFPNVQPVS